MSDISEPFDLLNGAMPGWDDDDEHWATHLDQVRADYPNLELKDDVVVVRKRLGLDPYTGRKPR